MVLIIDERPNRVVKSADMCPGHIGVVVMASVKEHLNNVVQYVGAVGGGFLWVEIGEIGRASCRERVSLNV